MAQCRAELHVGYEPSDAFQRKHPAWRRDGGKPQSEDTSLHHLLPHSRGGLDDDSFNLVRLPHAWHKAWHLAFGLATPEEAVAWLLDVDGGGPLPEVWKMCDPSETRLRALFPHQKYGPTRLASFLLCIMQGNLVWSVRAMRRLAKDIVRGRIPVHSLASTAREERESNSPLRYINRK